jgi:hypothetical protein
LFGHQPPVESVEQVFQCVLELRRGAVFGQFGLESCDVREPVEVEGLVGMGILGLALVQRFLCGRGLGAEVAGLEQEVSE